MSPWLSHRAATHVTSSTSVWQGALSGVLALSDFSTKNSCAHFESREASSLICKVRVKKAFEGGGRRKQNRLESLTSALSSSMEEAHPASTSSSPSAGSLINFLTLIQSLKTTKRTGWINHGVDRPESISDHMYRMAMMALIIDPKDASINRDRCIRMAIVHDVAEAIVGDITPDDGISKEEKNRREAAAIEHMCSLLGETPQAQEMRGLWLEYEAASTPEAKLVKDFDKLEMILQAQEYEASQGKRLDDFFTATAGRLQTDIGKKLADEIVVRRPTQG